jgi:membrane protein
MSIITERVPHWRIGGVDVTGVVEETAREVSDDDVSGLSAEMAYHTILAIFPFLLFLTGLTAIVDNVFAVGNLTDQIVEKASQVMPDDATSVLRSFTDEVVHAQGGTAIVIGLVGALWASSSGIGSAMKALNRAYDVREDRGFVRRKLVALALTILFGGLMLSAAMLIATGAIMAGGIGEALGWEDQFVRLWNWLT